jgi:hypothetical protein
MPVVSGAEYSALDTCVSYGVDADAAPKKQDEIVETNVISAILLKVIVVFMGRNFSLFGRNVRNSYKYEVFKRR